VDHKPKRTNDLRRLRNIREQPEVCLLADHYEEDWSRLWWVRADGVARVLVGDERDEPLTALAAKYAQYSEQPPEGPVIRIEVFAWRGWTGDR
jgi:PPOX class probable F420-dependent enzyme